MKRKLVISEDGSPTLYVPELDEHYHSIHGAIMESEHIFINECLLYSKRKNPVLFEAGFGTGLNAWLTLLAAVKYGLNVEYFAVEKYPLEKDEWMALNYGPVINSEEKALFLALHESAWEKSNQIHPCFSLTKIRQDLKTFDFPFRPDLVYFDAFSPDVQPGLWTAEIFSRIHHSMKDGGILTTYSVKGSVRRTLQDCGFLTEKIKGPPGKRHMLRAMK